MATTANLIGLGCPAPLAEKIADGVFTTLTPSGVVNATAAGVRTIMAINNVNDTTPTNAELTTSFGAPATVGSGFIGIVKDADTDTNGYLAFSNGVTWYWLKFTKAL